MNNIQPGTIARTIVLALALLNQILAISGKQVIELAENDIYQVVSLLFTIGASIVTYWKNNSFTKNAIEADKYLNDLREQGANNND